MSQVVYFVTSHLDSSLAGNYLSIVEPAPVFGQAILPHNKGSRSMFPVDNVLVENGRGVILRKHYHSWVAIVVFLEANHRKQNNVLDGFEFGELPLWHKQVLL